MLPSTGDESKCMYDTTNRVFTCEIHLNLRSPKNQSHVFQRQTGRVANEMTPPLIIRSHTPTLWSFSPLFLTKSTYLSSPQQDLSHVSCLIVCRFLAKLFTGVPLDHNSECRLFSSRLR